MFLGIALALFMQAQPCTVVEYKTPVEENPKTPTIYRCSEHVNEKYVSIYYNAHTGQDYWTVNFWQQIDTTHPGGMLVGVYDTEKAAKDKAYEILNPKRK